MMQGSDNHESRVNVDKKNIQQYMAVDRTILANERTLLAYVRTALTLLIVGASFIKFFNSVALEIVGWIFIPLGIFAGVMGFRRYKKTSNLIHEVEKKNGFFIPER